MTSPFPKDNHPTAPPTPSVFLLDHFHLVVTVAPLIPGNRTSPFAGGSSITLSAGKAPRTPSCQPMHHRPAQLSGNSTPTRRAPARNFNTLVLSPSGSARSRSPYRCTWFLSAVAVGRSMSFATIRGSRINGGAGGSGKCRS